MCIDKKFTCNSLVFRIGRPLQSFYYFLNLLFIRYFIGCFVADSLTWLWLMVLSHSWGVPNLESLATHLNCHSAGMCGASELRPAFGRAGPSGLAPLGNTSLLLIMEGSHQLFLVVNLSHLKPEEQNKERIPQAHNLSDPMIHTSEDQEPLFRSAFSFKRNNLNFDFS